MIREWTRQGWRSRRAALLDDPRQVAALAADPERWFLIQEWRARVSDAFQRGLFVGIGAGIFGMVGIHLAIEKWPW